MTTQVIGTSFDSVMDFRLTSNEASTPTQKIKFNSSIENYVTFDLTNLPPGIYNVEAELPGGAIAIKENAFIVGQWLPAELTVNTIAPSTVLLGNFISITIEFSNNGTTNLDISGLIIVSENGHPISFTPSGLSEERTELSFSTAEEGGDPSIMRPGYHASKTIYVKATNSNRIVLKYYPIVRRRIE